MVILGIKEGERLSSRFTLSVEPGMGLDFTTLISQTELKPTARCIINCTTQAPCWLLFSKSFLFDFPPYFFFIGVFDTKMTGELLFQWMIASGVIPVDTYLVRFSAGLRVRINNNLWYLITASFKEKFWTEFALLDQTWKNSH